MTDRTPRNRAARAAACAVLTLGVAATGYALPAPAHPALFGSLFPAAGADPIRVRAALTSPDTAPVYDISQVERKPSLRDPGDVTMMLQRAYPKHLHDTGIGGTVLVEMVVQPNGSVRQARVVNATHPELQEPARTVALTMRFAPAEKNGSPVGVRLQIPITFQPQGQAVTLVAPGVPVEASRPVDVVRTVDTVVVPAGTESAQVVTVPPHASDAQVETVTVPASASGARTETVSVPSRRTTTRVDTVIVPATTTGEVLPASAGTSTRGWTPSRAPTRAPARAVKPAQAETTVIVTTARTMRAAPTRAVTSAPTRATARGVTPAQTTVLTTTVPTTKAAASRAVTTARTVTAAPSRAVTAAPTTTLTTTARATKVAPARATRIAPVTARGQRPARAPKADPTPELLGRAIDPNAPPKPPAPAQP